MTIMDKTIDTITTTIFTPFSLVRVPAATPRTLSRAGDDILIIINKVINN
jgi:hypothetical protein